MKSFTFSFVVTLFLALPLYGDTIRTVDRDLTGVRVQSETDREVTYRKSSGGTARVPSEKVLTIFLSKIPEDLKEGLEAQRKGSYPKAIESLSKVKSSKYRAYVQFYIGESLRKIGKFDKAFKAYKFLEKSNHRLAPQARFQMGMLKIYQGDYTSAVRTFSQLREKSQNKYWSYRGRYGEGLAKLYQKRYDPAYSDFNRIAGVLKGTKDPLFIELRQLCDQGRGLSRVGTNSLKNALKIFDEIIRTSSNPEALSGAYLGVGRARYKMAQQGKDSKNNYKRALFAYLRVGVLYPSQVLQYAEALHFAAKCFEKLGKSDKADALKEEIKNRVPKWAKYKD